jgi:uncharacterized protein YjaG (DUF416 family)
VSRDAGGWFQAIESWGDVNPLEGGVEMVWTWVVKEDFDSSIFTKAMEGCEKMTPDMDNFNSVLASGALDAASAVAQALEVCIDPSCENAVDVCEIALECSFGVEQSGLGNSHTAQIADRDFLEKAAAGSTVLLEEDLQQRSLQVLRQEFSLLR